MTLNGLSPFSVIFFERMIVMNIQDILPQVDSEIFGIWFLIGAALVFFMQAGFAMVETGFTRAKNAGNIIMKNLPLSLQ